MKFNDYGRKQTKKTLWNEELDFEKSIMDTMDEEYINNLTPSFDLDLSQNHYEGKLYKCSRCGNKYKNHESEIYKGKLYCRACVQGLYSYDE
jgi:late competence protein required for DNA uptake (superfamily II DNA/RNA helicase)